MGTTLSGTIGFGLKIPQEFIETVEMPDEFGDDFGEWLDAELRGYSGLTWGNPYFYDTYDEYVVWIDNTTTVFYGAHVHSTDMFSHFAEAEDTLELRRFAFEHGIDYANAGIKIELSVG